MLNKTVASELQTERDNCNFDRTELANLFQSPEAREKYESFLKVMRENPEFNNTHKFYEYTADEVQQS
jgi:hypothetical protein